MLTELKEQVFRANLLLQTYGLVTLTWGNVSGIDRKKGIVVIKPSGVEYNSMKSEDMVCVELDTGRTIDSRLNPSSDTPTHLCLYKEFCDINGVVHTHSRFATIMAQAGLQIKAYGTTHADYFYGTVPCTRVLTETEIIEDYELNTGRVIAETFTGINPYAIPAVLVKEHGPFCWGENPQKAVETALVLEEIALMAYHNIVLDNNLKGISQALLDKHYNRKHGSSAYYGQ